MLTWKGMDEKLFVDICQLSNSSQKDPFLQWVAHSLHLLNGEALSEPALGMLGVEDRSRNLCSVAAFWQQQEGAKQMIMSAAHDGQ